MQVPGMTVMMSLVSTRNVANWHLWIRLSLHTIKCAVRVSWTQGMSMPDDENHTAQLENKTVSPSLPP